VCDEVSVTSDFEQMGRYYLTELNSEQDEIASLWSALTLRSLCAAR
jgi:hypothetical protein